IEKKYGVPAPVIVAFWGLESDFGANMGKEHSIKALTTLAYDCRRGDFFRGQLMDALRLIQNGDLRADEMIGSWAGEVGQIQMMPTEYNKFAVDFDGDGHRNLLKSVPDILASAGNYIQSLGWRAGEPWLRNVYVGANVPWDQADLTIQHPNSQWVKWGVRSADGKPLSGHAGFACAADGSLRAGVSRLSKFSSLFEVEPVTRLFADRRLLRDAARRRACDGQGLG